MGCQNEIPNANPSTPYQTHRQNPSVDRGIPMGSNNPAGIPRRHFSDLSPPSATTLEQSLFKLLHGSPGGRNNTPGIQGKTYKKGRRIRDRRVLRRCTCNRATCGESEGEGWLMNVTPNSSKRAEYFFWTTSTRGRVGARERWWESEGDRGGRIG